MDQKDIVSLGLFYFNFYNLHFLPYELAAIGRTLIPRYFRSIFEGGVTELYFNLRHSKESFHNTSITLDCDQCTMETLHGKPMYTKVITSSNCTILQTFYIPHFS